MTQNASVELAAIRQRARDKLFGGRIYDDVPDDKALERDASGFILPYCIISRGIAVPGGDRSIMGEEQQPYVIPIIFECWAIARSISEAMVGDVTTCFRGWNPSLDGNSDALTLRGGGSFQSKSSTGRPSRFMDSVNMALMVNLSIDPELDPQTA